jgi:hypothetical protein
LELGHWQIPDGLIQVQGFQQRIHHKHQRQVPPDASFGLQLTIFTTFSLKDELGWRKIAMSAYDEDSISVRGGEEGDACTHRSDPTEY